MLCVRAQSERAHLALARTHTCVTFTLRAHTIIRSHMLFSLCRYILYFIIFFFLSFTQIESIAGSMTLGRRRVSCSIVHTLRRARAHTHRKTRSLAQREHQCNRVEQTFGWNTQCRSVC